MLTPGIERVPTRSVPARHQLRYCPDKVSQDTLQQVQQALAPLLNPLDMTPLKPSQCGNVRPNHLELWLAD